MDHRPAGASLLACGTKAAISNVTAANATAAALPGLRTRSAGHPACRLRRFERRFLRRTWRRSF